MLYDLYNMAGDALASLPGPHVFLVRKGRLLERPPFEDYQVYPTVERKELRYVARLATGTLETGEYNLVVVLPGGQTAINQTFTLIEP